MKKETLECDANVKVENFGKFKPSRTVGRENMPSCMLHAIKALLIGHEKFSYYI